MDPRGGHNRYYFNKEFFKKWSSEMAYVLGFLVADGNITDAQGSSRTQYTKFSNTEKEIIEKIKKVLGSNHPIKIRKPKIHKHHNGFYKSSALFELRIGSKELFDDIFKLGIMPNKSKIIEFPNVPKNYLNHFIRGYFDGDGCIYIEYGKGKIKKKIFKRARTIFTSGSKKYLEGLQEKLIKNFHINNGAIYYQNRAFQLVYPTSSSMELYNLMYKNSKELFLERKYNIFKNYILNRQQRKNFVKVN